MTDDAGCLRKYAESRDESAFSEFVRRNVDLVYSAAFRQTGGDVHLAQDIAQKVFMRAAQKAAILGHHPVLAAWLYQTTRYLAIDERRALRRRQARESAADQRAEMIWETDTPVEWDKVSPELDKIIASLAERDRNAVILRFFGGKSYAEIGAQLHLTEGAARMRVERALEKLRLRLSRMGMASSCAALGAILTENGIIAAPAGLGTAVSAAALSVPAIGGLAAVGGTLYLMASAKITVTVATLVALASIGAAFHEYRHARVAEQALMDAERVRPPAQHEPVVASPHSELLQTQPERPVPTPAAPAAPAAAVHPKSSFSALLDLLDNPAMQNQNAIQAKIRLDGQYAAFFKNLNLTPEQIDQFKNLLVEKQMVGFDSMSAAHQQGIDAANDPKAFFQVVAEAQKTVDAQIAALLGADSYNQFQQYQTTIPARNTANLLTQALTYTSTPLTDGQAKDVVQALSQYGTPPLPPGNPFSVLNGDLGIIKLNEEGAARIQGILSPPQYQALQTKMQQQVQLLQARQRMGH